MRFNSDENALQIIIKSFSNYQKQLSGNTFLFVYYDTILQQHKYVEAIFTDANYKHLCGISNKAEDVEAYRKNNIIKEVVNGKVFAKLIKNKKLGLKHIISKKDGSTWQKLNILNNLYRITTGNSIYYVPEEYTDGMDCDAMIGLKNANITVAFVNNGNYLIPQSSLEYNLFQEKGNKRVDQEWLFDICLIAKKELRNRGKYDKESILFSNIDFNILSPDIQKMFEQ